MNKKTINNKGFTLIELIVVVAIIGMLSAVVMVSLSSAREATRDTTRKAQMIELSTAINHYFSENGRYPVTGPGLWYSSEVSDIVSNGPANNGDWIPNLVSRKMIGVLPHDPLGGDSTETGCTPPTQYKRAYMYRSDDGTHYKLISNCALEGGFPSSSDMFYDPHRPTWAIQITDSDIATASW